MIQHAAAIAAASLLACTVQAGPVEVRVTDASGRPLDGAVVFLESREAKVATRPMAGVEISQQDKAFVPPVSIVTTGTAVGFPNRDTVRHHVYSFSPVKKFEIKLYVGTPASPVVFDQPGVGVLGCNIHDHVVAWVVIVDTPWHGQTGSDGRGTAAQVPTGSYRLRTWHPDLAVGAPAADQPLRVAPGAVAAAVALAGVKS